jgi:hypothetical protein
MPHLDVNTVLLSTDKLATLTGQWLEALRANQVEVRNNRKTGLREIKYHGRRRR